MEQETAFNENPSAEVTTVTEDPVSEPGAIETPPEQIEDEPSAEDGA